MSKPKMLNIHLIWFWGFWATQTGYTCIVCTGSITETESCWIPSTDNNGLLIAFSITRVFLAIWHSVLFTRHYGRVVVHWLIQLGINI